MSDTMRGPVKVTHWTKPTGYIKGSFSGPVCGIDEKVDGWRSVNDENLKQQVTCEHCLYWLWDQEQPAKKLDVSRAVDDRVLNMRFDNRGMSAHDTELAIQRGTEAAIQRGIREGLAKVAEDFRATRPELMRIVEDGVERALQRGTVKQNLVGIHKIAVDDIDAEYEGSQEQSDDDEAFIEDVKTAVRNVLSEQERAGVGTQFVQNVYSPEALSPSDIYRQGKRFEPQNVTVNVESHVNPSEFKEMVKDAAREYDAETLETYDAEETVLMQKAVTSVVVSDQFQELVKKLVKVALDERDQEAHRRALEWQIAWSDHYLGLTPNASKISVELMEPVAEEPVVHYRRLYRTETACYLNGGADNVETTVHRNKTTCKDCKTEAGIN